MQIFFGACLFFVAVILLAYLPGKLALLLLKRTLSPLEDVTLACVLGFVVSGLAYWLIAFAHQAHLYVLWPQVEIPVAPVREGRTARSRDGEATVRQVRFGRGRSCRARCHGTGRPAAILHESNATGGRHHAGPPCS